MKLRAGDFVIAAAVIAAALLIWFFPRCGGGGEVRAEISQNGELVSTVKLSENSVIDLSGCTLKVSEGKIYMEDSDCPDKVCIKTGKIFRVGESIVCVPNMVSVKITGDGDTGADAVAG